MEAYADALTAAARRAVQAGPGPGGAARDTLRLCQPFQLPAGHPAGEGNWGVRARCAIQKGTLLGLYLGHCRTGNELDRMQIAQLQLRVEERQGDIVLLDSLYELPAAGVASDTLVMNAAVATRRRAGPSRGTTLGGLFNDYTGVAAAANVTFMPGIRGAGVGGIGPTELALPLCFLATVRDVGPGEELLTSYGDGGEYWPKMEELKERKLLLRQEEENVQLGRPSAYLGRVRPHARAAGAALTPASAHPQVVRGLQRVLQWHNHGPGALQGRSHVLQCVAPAPASLHALDSRTVIKYDDTDWEHFDAGEMLECLQPETKAVLGKRK